MEDLETQIDQLLNKMDNERVENEEMIKKRIQRHKVQIEQENTKEIFKSNPSFLTNQASYYRQNKVISQKMVTFNNNNNTAPSYVQSREEQKQLDRKVGELTSRSSRANTQQ